MLINKLLKKLENIIQDFYTNSNFKLYEIKQFISVWMFYFDKILLAKFTNYLV